MDPRAPSGLFPSGPLRPTFREPHRVRVSAAFAGAGTAAAWLLLVGLLGSSTGEYVWLTVAASVISGLAALMLARLGDRGVAVGIAITTGVCLAIAMGLVVQRWATTGWPLW